MSIELQLAKRLAEETTRRILSGSDEWKDFLESSTYTYKYSIINQIAIYSQRSDARFCARLTQWNKMGRQVKRGSGGIRLLQRDGFETKEQYVFDRSDTIKMKDSKEVLAWQMEDRFMLPVATLLAEEYESTLAPSVENFKDIHAEAVKKETFNASVQFIDKFTERALNARSEEVLTRLDNLNRFMEQSLAYVSLNRMGLLSREEKEKIHFDMSLIPEDLKVYRHFSYYGEILQTGAWQILTKIEKNIKNILAKEYSLEYNEATKREEVLNDGNYIQTGRGLSGSEHRRAAAAIGNGGGLGTNERSLSLRGIAPGTRNTVSGGRAEAAPFGHRQGSGGEIPTAYEDDSQSRGRDGGAESPRPDGMGKTDDQYPSKSEGSRHHRNYQSTDAHLLEENITKLQGAESETEPAPLTFFHVDTDYTDKPGILKEEDLKTVIDVAIGSLSAPRSEIYEFLKVHYEPKVQEEYVKQIFDIREGDLTLASGAKYHFRLHTNGIYFTDGENEHFRWWVSIAECFEAIRIDNEYIDSGIPSVEAQLSFFTPPSRILVKDSKVVPQAIIDRELRKGGVAFGGKERLYRFFTENHTTKEKADFLSKEYGIGGSSHILSGSGYNVDYSGKGLSIAQGYLDPEREITLPWAKVAVRIDELIAAGTYLYSDELAAFRAAPISEEESIIAEVEEIQETPEPEDVAAAESKPAIDTEKSSHAEPISEPMVTITFSESAELSAGQRMPLSEANEAIRKLDAMRVLENDTGEAVGYDKTYFTIEYIFGGEECHYEGRQDIGDGDGSLIDHIEDFYRYSISPEYKDYVLRNGSKEAWEEIYTSGKDFLEQVIPYFRSFEKSIPEQKEEIAEAAQQEEAATEQDYHYQYNMLSRLKADCDYFLGAGNRAETHLWAGSISAQLLEMRRFYAQIPEDLKPEWLTASDIDYYEQQMQEIPLAKPETNDYSITDDDLGKGSKSERFKANVSAIRTLKQIEAEERDATEEEQHILAGYVGWGGLSEAFEDGRPQNAELKALLTKEEYEAARESTLNAFYTSPLIVKEIYKVLQRFGFTGGKILEPSCGSGNFLGAMPKEVYQASKITGVELDPLTGRIARNLYPAADIQIKGFEETSFRNDSFDLAIGNVPFGDYGVSDSAYPKGLLIHDYFFLKSIDKVRAGGLLCFITSTGTMDKESSKVRESIARKCELIGAVRLPNDAFYENAGTKTSTDILFLKKREKTLDLGEELPAWINTSEVTIDGRNGAFTGRINRYFAEHQEMLAGKLAEVSTQFGSKLDCIKDEEEITRSLPKALSYLSAEYMEREAAAKGLTSSQEEPQAEEAPEGIPPYSFAVIDGELWYHDGKEPINQNLSGKKLERAVGLCKLRDITNDLIHVQREDMSDETIAALRADLNHEYDVFIKQHGYLSNKENEKLFYRDFSYPLLCSLENRDEDGNVMKGDMFSKRTIKKAIPVASTDTAEEALAVSLRERGFVDIPFIANLCRKSEEVVIKALHGQIYFDPALKKYVAADEYLSGNIRQKLEAARFYNEESAGEYADNITALEQVMPQPLTASDIDVRLGSMWVPEKYYTQFVTELLELPFNAEVSYSPGLDSWKVTRRNAWQSRTLINSTYGTERANAFRLIEDSLNLRSTRIFDTDDEGKSVLNPKETLLAKSKQEAVKSAFKAWIFKDMDRRDELCRIYNEKFNSVRPRTYDGSHLTFPEMNPHIELKAHQKRAVARQIYGGNTLLAHCVGAGKTYEMITAVMEKKRLGLCSKAMIVVPNGLIGQWASEFYTLYPAANVLAVTEKDFAKSKRREFCSRIATSDLDAVIIAHSQFEMIPMSADYQKKFLNAQIDELEREISMVKNDDSGRNISVKQLQAKKKRLDKKLKDMAETKDPGITFEDLGVDFICVDESHAYKNLAFATKMGNVAGVQSSGSNRAFDMFVKCRYMDEMTGGKGITFATGTYISNSISEMYTVQRYLQYDTLKDMGMSTFDNWASTFGETVTKAEIAPEGNTFRHKTRFAKFFNLPELMNMVKEFADFQTQKDLGIPIPKAEYIDKVIKPSQNQKAMMDIIGKRADLIRKGLVNPTEDNMLNITNDGRKLAVDERLCDIEIAEAAQVYMDDIEQTKIEIAATEIANLYHETADKLSTQLVFCDIGTPKSDGSFSVYEELKQLLVGKGVSEEDIAFIHTANNTTKRNDLFSKMRAGKVRVLIGSTAKMGAGMNVQDKLITEHHIDVPWRPSDIQQREGRILRQGNENEDVKIYRYITESTFDAYSWQTIENKQRAFYQVLSGEVSERRCEDIDPLELSAAQAKALATGNPLLQEKIELDIKVNELNVLKAGYEREVYRNEDRLHKTLPKALLNIGQKIEALKKDVAYIEAHPVPSGDDFKMEVNGDIFDERTKAGTALLYAAAANKKTQEFISIGNIGGFKLRSILDTDSEYKLQVERESKNIIGLGKEEDIAGNPVGITMRITNYLSALPKHLADAELEKRQIEKEMDDLEIAIKAPFDKEQELADCEKRLAELNLLFGENDEESELNRALIEEEKRENQKRNHAAFL